MNERLEYNRVAPEASRAMSSLDSYLKNCSLEASLIELVKVRASQINGCAYCIDMHTKNARAAGESEQRLYELAVWQETDFYSARERAALAWTEAVTLISKDHVPDEVYEEAVKCFSERELVDLTVAVISINGWNRLSIAFRRTAGTYRTPGADVTYQAGSMANQR